MNQFFQDEKGRPMLLLGLQTMNSSTGSPLVEKAIQAVKKYHGNVLEAPIYWNVIEPEKDRYEMKLVKDLIDQVRAAGLRLIILWFATSKNGHPNYAPDYVKLDPQTYQITVGPTGGQNASLSPHGLATLERDKKAYCEVLKFLKEYDGEKRTVLGIQIENEMGLANTDRDYSLLAQKDYEKPLPEELKDVHLEDCGKCDGSNTWRGHFGRHAHEAFSAWYHARFIGEIARAGKEIYPELVTYTNVMVGEQGVEENGWNYNAGAAVGRVLDIWKIAAPKLDLICPDIYNPAKKDYTRIAARYTRPDNALFIPESATGGEANAMNALRAIADFGCIGICGFGAEWTLDGNGELLPDNRTMMYTMQTIRNLSPLLIKYRGTGKVHAILQDEFASQDYLKLEKFHVLTHFFRGSFKRFHGATRFNPRLPENQHHMEERGRALLIEVGEYEYYLAGVGVGIDFIRRPDPEDTDPWALLSSRQSTQLNHLSIEEGHFDENGNWVIDFLRNGDQTNYEIFLHEGEAVHVRLNPGMSVKVV